ALQAGSPSRPRQPRISSAGYSLLGSGSAGLGSLGLTTNADGLLYHVQGPFAAKEESPAWRAGLRVGDRLDLAAMRCVPVDTEICASNLAMWGGVSYVMPGRTARS